ncbi:MAG: rRNA maturation RNase YbeY [Eubacterium sp.]|nr:rRNA maturation RNase YbeY [Eubacterium sp.]MBR4240720.1 rRNA maturation RNase YbeY [Eubacterium sp.]MBR7061358.1 rRNA maturation RNase YbeY [Eubacterium sp.]
MIQAKVLISDEQKEVELPRGTKLLVRRCCKAVLNEEKIDGKSEISVTFVDNKAIHELNKLHRNIDRETDVLSFPLGENGEFDINPSSGAKLLGDIVISAEKALEQAKLYNHSVQREIGFLTVHSMLHLLGYDHELGGIEEVHMREKEEKILTKIGLKRDNSYYDGEE